MDDRRAGPPPWATPDLCRAAREMIGWSAEELAMYAQIPRHAFDGFEAGMRGLRRGDHEVLRLVLELAGIEVFEQPDGAFALRRKP